MRKPKDFFKLQSSKVIGIGASAGGTPAIKNLFNSITEDCNAAFIVVMHLPVDYESSLHKILRKHTSMEVIKAENDQVIEDNKIYVCDGKKEVLLKNGKLQLQEDKSNFPIDAFFTSMAKEYKENAAVIVLSGSGTDGTKGCQEIIRNEGRVIVQAPEEAEFNSMPLNIVNTGSFDFVLRLKEMQTVLRNLFTPVLYSNHFAEIVSNENWLNEIIKKVSNQTGIDFSSYKKGTLLRSIEKQMSEIGIESIRDYYDILISSGNKIEKLKQSFLIGVTSFFRDNEAFEIIRNKVIPNILNQEIRGKEIRIWMPGCSTGQEPFSIAMILHDYITTNKLDLDFKIFATDVNINSINNATKLPFTERAKKEVPHYYFDRYFIANGKQFKIHNFLRKKIVFSYHNLLSDPPFIRMNMVVCRNVLIYFNLEEQKKILRSFQFSLNKNGFLFLGNSEALVSNPEDFETISGKWKIFKCISDRKITLNLNASYPKPKNVISKVITPSVEPPPMKLRTERLISKGSLFNQYLINYQCPPSIFIDYNYNILFTTGDLTKRLFNTEGAYNNNLLKRLDPGLSEIFRTTIQKLRKENKDVHLSKIKLELDNTPNTFNITFHELKENKALSDVILICFEPYVNISEEQKQVVSLAAIKDFQQQSYVDLDLTNIQLQERIEELEYKNDIVEEDLSIANNELLVTNEELQNSIEELQSLNEELHTVNGEFQNRNQELESLNKDVYNMLNGSNLSVLFLDKDLNIRKFTVDLQGFYHIENKDIGRSFLEFSSNLSTKVHKELVEAAKTVLKTNSPIEKEIKINGSSFLFVRILPFKVNAVKSDGVVINFTDISSVRLIQKDLENSKDQFERLFQNYTSGICIFQLNEEKSGKITGIQPINVNRKMMQLFNSTPCDILDLMVDLLDKHEHLVELCELSARTLNPQEWEFFFEEIDKHLNIKIFQLHEDIFVLLADDVTERKKATALIEENLQEQLKLNAIKSRFVANVSHQFRTPLTVIQSSLAVMEMTPADQINSEKLAKMSERIKFQINSMTFMLDNLLNLERIRSNENMVKLESVNLEEVCSAEIEKMNSIQNDNRKANLTVTGDFSLAHANENLFKQVISNALSNAFKYSKGQPAPELLIDYSSDKVLITIKDFGIGIPKNEIQDYFIPFFRASNAVEIPGTGLGSSIIKEYVNAMQGTVTIESKLDQYTLLRVQLNKNQG